MKTEFSKRVRALLRQLAGTAYERELRIQLSKLDDAFVRWRRAELDTLDLADEVDRFTRGRARRDLDHKYNVTSLMPLMVAQAIVRGFLKPEEVPAEILDALKGPIEDMRQGLKDGTVCFDEEED